MVLVVFYLFSPLRNDPVLICYTALNYTVTYKQQSIISFYFSCIIIKRNSTGIKTAVTKFLPKVWLEKCRIQIGFFNTLADLLSSLSNKLIN